MMKTKYPIHIMVFGEVTSNDNIMLPFIFPHGLILKCIGLHQVPGGSSAVQDCEGGCWKTQRQATELCYTLQVGEPGHSCEKISATTLLLTSGSLTCQIAISLIILHGVQLSERLTKLCATPKMNWRQG